MKADLPSFNLFARPIQVNVTMPAKADTSDRQDRLAQRRSGQPRLRPGAGWLGAVCRHGREFSQYHIDEGIDVPESIPRGRRRLGGSDGDAHMLRIRWLLAMT